MPQYLMLLYDDVKQMTDLSPEDMQRIVAEYGAWARGLGEQGKLVAGEKLTDEGGRVLRPNGGQVAVTDGPFTETKEVIAGLFIVKADSYDDAVAIAKSCPHARQPYGVRIDVRQIEDFGGGE